MDDPAVHVHEETPAPTPPAPQGKSGRTAVLVSAVAIAALAIATATWFVAKRQIDDLRRDVDALRDNQRQLAVEVMQGRKGGAGPVGQVIDVAKAAARGRRDAVVTLVEFSDYECPFCIRHFQQTMPRIEENYIQPGKIRYVFRDFPIDANHPQAVKAHEAAHCALEQDKFWDVHSRLFSAPGTHTPLALEDVANGAGLNVSAFRACIASGRTTAGIREAGSLADTMGATGTPWFFVGLRDLKTDQVHVLKPIGGAQPYEQFAIALDAALKQADQK